MHAAAMPHLEDSADASRRSSPALMARMSAMMFLQYWPLGIWGVTVGTFIAANTGSQGARIFSAGFVGYSTAASAIGSLLSPVALGFLSDRFLSAQYLVALMHVGCAAATWGMHQSDTQTAFFLWLLVYYHCFIPAIALTNKIALTHLANADAEYPLVRVFGTGGWIAAGLFLGFAWPLATGESIEATRTPLMLSAIGSIVMLLFALTLPNTPPERGGGDALPPRFCDSGAIFRNRPLVVFLFVSMLACIPSMAYNNYGNLFLNRYDYPRPAALMTLGQAAELLVLLIMPWLIRHFGLRAVFVSGVVAWAMRYLLLAAGSYFHLAAPVLVAILIHGPCYAFVYIAGVMYVDKLADPAHRGAAQGTYALASTGLGHLLGALTVGYSQALFLTPEGVSPPPYNWPAFWIVPATISVAALIVFKFAFRPPRQVRDEALEPLV